MVPIVFYTRSGCHLCEDARVWLDELSGELDLSIEEVDIDVDTERGKKYIEKIPVVIIGELSLYYPFYKSDLKLAILTTTKIHAKKPQLKISFEKWVDWLDSHWLIFINGFFGAFLTGSFLPPILEKLGALQAARIFYGFYGFFCHQLAFRSIFLFGRQWAYPRELAGVQGLLPFGTATGISEADLFAARDFIGDNILGFKVALCERDLGMYMGILVFGFLFSMFRKRFSGLPLWAWLVFALIPIGVDGGTQLLSQLPIPSIENIFPLRESTPLLRAATGFIFGFGTAWLTFPVIHAGMKVRP